MCPSCRVTLQLVSPKAAIFRCTPYGRLSRTEERHTKFATACCERCRRALSPYPLLGTTCCQSGHQCASLMHVLDSVVRMNKRAQGGSPGTVRFVISKGGAALKLTQLVLLVNKSSAIDWQSNVLATCGCRGYLVIAEVASRIASLPEFIGAIEGLGFKNNKQVSIFVGTCDQATQAWRCRRKAAGDCCCQRQQGNVERPIRTISGEPYEYPRR